MGTSQPVRRGLEVLAYLLALLSSASGENDRDFKMCGTWHHGNGPLTLTYDLKMGCRDITLLANESSMSLRAQITARCEGSGAVPLPQALSRGETWFCVFWEPILDQLIMEMGGENHTLCPPSGLQGPCCTDLSQGTNYGTAPFGIVKGMVRNDIISFHTHSAYHFYGEVINCKEEFCEEVSQGPDQVNNIEETVLKSKVLGIVELPCALSSVVEMNQDFQGFRVTLPAPLGVPPETIPSVHLPPGLKPPGKSNATVVCTLYWNSSLFQDHSTAVLNDIRILDKVVGITVENEVITNLPEPIRIAFHHDAIPETHSRKCVSWDRKRDPLEVSWRKEGCVTFQNGLEDTECHCNHLTYFAILVQMETRQVRHLLALSVITSMGCVVSMLSCVAIIVFLNKQRRAKETSVTVHRGLAMALFLLNLLFFLTGLLANVGGAKACLVVGPALHYALLSSFSWMAIEVFHTFWLVYVVFSPSPKPYVWQLIGFGIPVIPVLVLVFIGNIYGVREVVPIDDVNDPYFMCWMQDSDDARLAHYLTNVPFLVLVVGCGLVMLVLVVRKIQNREEWRNSRVAFLSIWGLSCLFGTTWGLGFLDFGPLSDVVVFLFCILNSLQGFFLMLRFYVLDRMKKQSESCLGGSSTGSTRQHMLQEKNCG